MPDDDRLSRDHGRGWKPVLDFLTRRTPALRDGESPPPDGQNPKRLDRAIAKALRETLHTVTPAPTAADFRSAAGEAHRLAEQQRRGHAVDLCPGGTRAATPALLRQAVRVAVARDGPDHVGNASPEELAEEIAREFLHGMGRRYGLDRIAAQVDTDAPGLAGDLLGGLDMFFAGPLVGALVSDLLSEASSSSAAPRREVA
ncbi:hypothetical protein RIF23_10680 [Lipingzhangella sp. LS1_29]|uniref:Uncharacterized protein n=1 Tax=Lipingzhangella rawalii TaxID=2055835 RepID=A0ABU2H7E4_9ACTN|nr:hypothetical protein [Lipingzhangella rawalii]MDS1270765.1 hypothetical protein [Lipingzhangella rawalii]